MTGICVNCGAIIGDKALRYCTRQCRKSAVLDRKRAQNSCAGLPSVTSGAIKELLVAADLMTRGLHVYRALSSSCPVDLQVLMGDGTSVGVEVKTGTVLLSGDVSSPKHHTDFHHVLAVVAAGEIHYQWKIEPRW